MENSNFNTETPEKESVGYEEPGVINAPQSRYVTYIPYGFTPKTFEEKNGIKKVYIVRQ